MIQRVLLQSDSAVLDSQVVEAGEPLVDTQMCARLCYRRYRAHLCLAHLAALCDAPSSLQHHGVDGQLAHAPAI